MRDAIRIRTHPLITHAVVLAVLLAPVLGSPLGNASMTGVAPDVGNTVYLPNVTKMLGGPDGWQTPFIVQNVGSTSTQVQLSFYSFADGTLAKTRIVPDLGRGRSFFHDPNSDAELVAGGQYSVVARSSTAPMVAVVNEHQNVSTPDRQESLSYQGLSEGSTTMYAPFFTNVVGQWLTTLVVQNLGTRPTEAGLVFRRHLAGLPTGVSVVLKRAIEPRPRGGRGPQVRAASRAWRGLQRDADGDPAARCGHQCALGRGRAAEDGRAR